MSAVAVFAAAGLALYAAHHIGDYWVQTHHQATRKAWPGWDGRLACTLHVAGYLATQAAVLLVTAAATGLPLPPAATATALVTSGVTHWVADRRWPIRRAAVAIGKTGFYNLGDACGSGAHMLDQSLHIACSVLAPALIIAAAVHAA